MDLAITTTSGWRAVVCVGLSSAFLLGCAPEAPPSEAAGVAADAPVEALGIDWFEGDVEAAFAAARAADKPLFLYWGAQWCPYCKQVNATIFTRRDVIDRTRQFVAVELDGDAPSAQRAGERFGVRGYPTMIVFRPDGTEITRIPNVLNLEAYAEVFDLAMNAMRPVADLVAGALAGEELSTQEWRQLAVYSWGQDNQRALGERDPSATFGALARACPASAGTACLRLAMNHLKAAIGEAGEAGLDAATRAAAFGDLSDLLGDDATIVANLDTVLHSGAELVAAVTEPGTPERETLSARWETVMLGLADDPRLSTVEQFYASYAPLDFLRLHDAGAAVPVVMQTGVRERVSRALDTTTDPIERHAVVTTASSLLRAAELPGEAASLLEAELASSKQPYYLMSGLASHAEREGEAAEALAWRKRAYDTATGGSTRFRWGYGYVSALIRLTPDSLDDIENAAAGLFEEFDDPAGALFGGTQARAVRLSEALLAWADTPERTAVLTRVKGRVAAVCEAIPANDTGRERCDAFLASEPSGSL